MVTLKWQNANGNTSEENTSLPKASPNGPWFALSMGLMGMIVGFMLVHFLPIILFRTPL